MGIDISVVIPAYNEAATIAGGISLLDQFLSDARARSREIIVVDDGSADGTADAARAASDDVRVVSLDRNRGKGAAARAGVAETSGDVVIVTDADGDYLRNPSGPYLDALSSGADIVLACREHRRSEWTCADGKAAYTRERWLLGRAYNLLVRTIVPLPYRDTQTGLKFFAGDAARSLFAAVRTDRFAYDVELLTRARRRGHSVVELPLVYYCSTHQTKVRFVDKPRMVLDLFHIRSMCRGERRLATVDSR